MKVNLRRGFRTFALVIATSLSVGADVNAADVTTNAQGRAKPGPIKVGTTWSGTFGADDPGASLDIWVRNHGYHPLQVELNDVAIPCDDGTSFVIDPRSRGDLAHHRFTTQTHYADEFTRYDFTVSGTVSRTRASGTFSYTLHASDMYSPDCSTPVRTWTAKRGR
jgi:hypothetical protein